ncbi:ABC transporter arginine-binding protein 1 precursor [Leminorella richardii]|uniref:ABC transporter arginine-binding protein 1 n=1 Tax=Leminorella richardii TaxID=158841 RepID=A0A2X4UN73_9GAMM|nr:arginine ABC transporter substrate-binding protein [Leminorella richardii]SQI41286.1 ABC transporter arginine-binding protein 1 precursor [Leminorella richardii]
MKKVLATLLFASVALSAQAAETIRFASSATYPPFEYIDKDNQIAGFDIDLAKALCQEMKAECTYSNHPFDSLIPALKFRRYDAVISGMDITAERSKQVLFSQPYYANSAVLIVRKGTVTSPDQMKGKKVGMENGSTHQKYMNEKHPEVNTVPYDSYQTAVIDLKNGRLDAVFGDTAAVNEWLKTNPDLETLGEHIADPAYFGSGLGIAVRQDNAALMEKINGALDALKANGVYKQINDKWFPN